MNTYVFSDSERQEYAISAIYDALDRFPARESKRTITINPSTWLRSMIVFVVSLAVINIAALLYIVSMWS